jgi:glycosyltransferase involved in cell wall biosynthesis
MSVVHVVAAGEIGGAERMLTDLAAATAGARRKHYVALFTPSAALHALFRDRGIEVDDRGRVREGPLPYLLSTFGPSDVAWLTRVLERRRAAVVHLHTFASQVLGTRAALRVGARIVRTEHSTRVYDDPSCWPFSRWSLARTDAVVCISKHVHDVARSRAGSLVPQHKTSIVYNGIDTDRFAPAPARPDAESIPVRFLALGRLDRRKGLDVALTALAQVSGATLDIVGDGEERAALEDLATQLGVRDRVRFLGHQSDVRAAIAASDVALSSAREEGLGIALLEAMAMSKPVVACPTGGIPEVVTDGETGWLAGDRSAGSIARAMLAASASPAERRRRGEAARARVVETFSVTGMRASYEAVYATLAPR